MYNLNSFLRLSKDIDDIKKKNLVKNDIQRKLSLKSQWLSTKYGSTGNLNNNNSKKNKTKVNCKNNGDRNKIYSSSAECLKKSDGLPNGEHRKKAWECKWASTQCLVPINHNSQKSIKLKNTIDRVKDLHAKYVEPKASADSAKRDLSRFFPPKNETVCSSKVLENPKELKDINLSKYFLPSPVQELKSIPSPVQSSQLTRKIISEAHHQPGSTVPVELRTPKKNSNTVPEKRLSYENNEIACNSSLTVGEYVQLVEGLNTPTDDIDEMFDEVAAALFDVPVQSEKLRCHRIEDKMENSPMSKSSTASFVNSLPASKWKAAMSSDDAILSKLSGNLLKEIDKLEKHLQINENLSGKNRDKSGTGKIASNIKSNAKDKNCSRNIPADTLNIVKSDLTPVPPLRRRTLQLTDKANQDKCAKCCIRESSNYNGNTMEKFIPKDIIKRASNHFPTSIGSTEVDTMNGNVGNKSGEHMSAHESETDKFTVEHTSQINNANFTNPELSSSNYLYEAHTSPISKTSIVEDGNQKQTKITTEQLIGSEIPPEMLCKRQEYLLESVSPLERVSSVNNIVTILEGDCNVKRSCNNFTQDLLNSSTRSQPDETNNYYSPFNDPINSMIVENITEHEPPRPLRTKRKDPTEQLIERSQLIHNKKQEFMNEKLFGTNPYIKRPLVRDFGERVIDKNQLNDFNVPPETTTISDNIDEYEKSNPEGDADVTLQNKIEKSSSLKLLNTNTPPTTNLNVFELFKRNSPNNKQTPNGKDGCIIS